MKTKLQTISKWKELKNYQKNRIIEKMLTFEKIITVSKLINKKLLKIHKRAIKLNKKYRWIFKRIKNLLKDKDKED